MPAEGDGRARGERNGLERLDHFLDECEHHLAGHVWGALSTMGVVCVQTLRFQLLGPVRAFRLEREIPLGSPAQRTVLAGLLLRQGDIVTLNSISRLLWLEDRWPVGHEGLVRTYVSRLRRALGPSAIERIHNGYRISTDVGQLDLAEFRIRTKLARSHRDNHDLDRAVNLLRAALALWQGAPVMGTVKPFTEYYFERLEELRVDAIELCLAIEIDRDNHEGVVNELLAAVTEHPLRERLVILCMIALQRCGRTAQAIAIYTRTREMLATEMGIDPGPELQDCYHAALRRGAP
jgi:DNA-binding SARP family transcriptional activator